MQERRPPLESEESSLRIDSFYFLDLDYKVRSFLVKINPWLLWFFLFSRNTHQVYNVIKGLFVECIRPRVRIRGKAFFFLLILQYFCRSFFFSLFLQILHIHRKFSPVSNRHKVQGSANSIWKNSDYKSCTIIII